jgi:hypothetical protein
LTRTFNVTIARLTTLGLAMLLLMAAESIVGTSAAWAAPQAGCGCQRRHGGCRRCQEYGCVQCPECSQAFCPPAEEYCELCVTQEKVEHECFEVDYKTICIPKVIPPWRRGCEPVCAEARSVKVLTTKKYECPACQYKWEVRQPALPQFPGCDPVQDPGLMPAQPAPVPVPPAMPPTGQHGIQPWMAQPAATVPGAGLLNRSASPVSHPESQPGNAVLPGYQPYAIPQSQAIPHGQPAPQSQPEQRPAAPTPAGGTLGDYFGQR